MEIIINRKKINTELGKMKKIIEKQDKIKERNNKIIRGRESRARKPEVLSRQPIRKQTKNSGLHPLKGIIDKNDGRRGKDIPSRSR